jgi:hypothetical protein
VVEVGSGHLAAAVMEPIKNTLAICGIEVTFRKDFVETLIDSVLAVYRRKRYQLTSTLMVFKRIGAVHSSAR